MDARRLTQIAAHLAAGGVSRRRGEPHQTDLRRAISAAYYALFHTLATVCADQIAGAVRSSRSQAAWRQTYRALEHRETRNRIANKGIMARFPSDIIRFAENFVLMQDLRHLADYDPDASFSKSEVSQLVQEAERSIGAFKGTPKRDQRAFSIYVLLRSRPD